MGNILLSIIVPIYNVEKYLDQCIQSILRQTFENFELILVDDGSPDSCPAICDMYAKQDSRVRVIHKPNGGLVSARKSGLSTATGLYIAYVDGDDWISPDMYEVMLNTAIINDADIVVTGYCEEYESRSVVHPNPAPAGVYKDTALKKLTETMLYTGIFYEQDVIPALWNKMFKRALLLKNQYKVSDIIRMGEDAACTYPCLLDAKCVVIDKDFYPYHYRIIENSMTHTFDPLYFERLKSLFAVLEEKFCEAADTKAMEQLNYYKLFIIRYGIESLLDRKTRMSFLKKMRIINKAFKDFNLKVLIQNIDWAGFSKIDKQQFTMLYRHRTFVLKFYYKRFLQRIRNYLKKRDIVICPNTQS
ncbi:MAG: glycosyltransferase family 2 protein [Treponema sp.]